MHGVFGKVWVLGLLLLGSGTVHGQVPPAPGVAVVRSGEWPGWIGGYASSVSTFGNYACVVGGEPGGLKIFDVSQRSAPVLVGSYEIDASDVVVEGQIAYALSNDGLHLIDLAEPAGPKIRGSYSTTLAATSFIISEGFAYLADPAEGVAVVDVSNPADPKRIGIYPTQGEPWEFHTLAASGSYVYVSDLEDIDLVNVQDPRNPRLVGRLNIAAGIRTFAATASHLIVATRNQNIQVFDVVDPAHPVARGIYPAGINPTNTISCLSLIGNRLYVATEEDLVVYDASDLGRPVEIARVNRGTFTMPDWGHSSWSALAGNPARLCVAAADGLLVLNLEDLARPELVGSFVTNRRWSTVEVAGDYAYVPDGRGLQVLNIRELAKPSPVANWSPNGFISKVILLEQCAYFSAGSDLWLADISNPALPMQIGHYRNPDGQFYFTVAAGRAYLVENYSYSDGGGLPAPLQKPKNSLRAQGSGDFFKLSILDLSHPTNIVKIGEFKGESEVSSMGAAGHYLYLAREGALVIMDVSDPAKVTPSGVYRAGGGAFLYSVELADLPAAEMPAGSYCFAGVTEPGGKFFVYLVNVTDPSHPVLVGNYETGVNLHPILLRYASGRLYAMCRDESAYQNELHVIDVRNPSSPVRLNRIDALPAGLLADMAVTRDGIIFAQYEGGITTYRLQEVPRILNTTAFSTGGRQLNFAATGSDPSRFSIESTESLKTPDWKAVAPVSGIAQQADGSFQAELPPDGPTRFYRVSSPLGQSGGQNGMMQSRSP
jgi:hypothetical protein